MKRYLSITLIFILLLSTAAAMSGCQIKGNDSETEKTNASEKRLSIVTTIFPQYDFARQIVGDRADMTMLLAPGAESHSYEPSPQDIIKIQNSDIFIYNGGENDVWVDNILDSIDHSDIKIIKLLDCVDPLGEVLKEGMEPEEEEAAAEPDASEAGDGIEYDEHVWTSPKNAIIITNVIRDIVCYEDSANADYYQSNAKQYTDQLTELDNEFTAVIGNAKRKTFVFGDRFPLRYFADCYGLDYWAAFPGCSSETEPSAATVAFLVDKVKADHIPVVFKIELSTGNVAKSIAKATGAKVMTFYSCHNLSGEDFENGETYVSLMKRNVESLKEALN